MSNIPANNPPDGAGDGVQVEVSIRHRAFAGGSEPIEQAARAAAALRGVAGGRIEVAVVDDPTIHRLNREHLGHDWPTDVVSFPYEQTAGWVEGEVIASWDTAVRAAREAGWAPTDELLLYVIHGTLHVAGMDDQSPEGRRAMRRAEAAALRRIGIAEPERHGPADDADEAPPC